MQNPAMDWRTYLTISDTYFNGEPWEHTSRGMPGSDAMDHALSLDADNLTASVVEPITYMECSVYASLDDEIEASERY